MARLIVQSSGLDKIVYVDLESTAGDCERYLKRRTTHRSDIREGSIAILDTGRQIKRWIKDAGAWLAVG